MEALLGVCPGDGTRGPSDVQSASIPSRGMLGSASPEEGEMDANAKKTALRMIPYGLYVLTAAHKDGRVAAAAVNWVTQASFEPPLVAVGVKADSGAHALIKDTKAFALNVLGKVALVTGASGLVGGAVVARLVGEGMKVRGLMRRPADLGAGVTAYL